MSYTVSIHKQSSVRHSACAELTAPGVYSLILARTASIDVYAIQSSGLVLQHSTPVNGTVSSLLSFKPTNSHVSWLFVTTEEHVCFTLSYKDGKLVTEQVLRDLDDRLMPETDMEHLGIIDPDSRGILLHFNKGSLTYISLVPVSKSRSSKSLSAKSNSRVSSNAITGTLYPPIKLPIEELIIISIIFLANTEKPAIAVLYRDGQHAKHIKVYEIIVLEGRLEEIKGSGMRNVDQGATRLIALPSPAGGFLLLGEQIITYYSSAEDVRPKKIPFEGPTIFCAYARIDENGQRYLLGDESGHLFMLQLEFNSDKVESWKVNKIGETSIPTTLTYIDSGFFFVTSHFSPSTLFFLSAEAPHVQTLQIIPNLAPITDFQIVSRENSTDIVACSGAFKSGALRIVRSGVGVDILAELAEAGDVTGLWTVGNSIVVVSYIERTAILKGNFETGDIEDVSDWNFIDYGQPTISVGVFGEKMVHINKTAVKLIDIENNTVRSYENTISAAYIAEDYIIISTSLSNEIHMLDNSLKVLHSASLPNEVSCITATSELCFVGQWGSSKVLILNRYGLQKVGETETLLGGIPRSLQVTKLESMPKETLFVGMADGTLYTFRIDQDTVKSGELLDRKSMLLGTQPVSLYKMNNAIFAVSSHPTMIYGHSEKIALSTVNVPIPTALSLCHIADNTTESDDILVFASENKIYFGIIDSIMSTHVQTLELHETARRLTILSSLTSLVGLISLKTELDTYNNNEIVSCSVKLVDMSIFEISDTFCLDENEMAESITSGKLDGSEYIVVGTGYISDEKEEYENGRILVFEVTADKKLSLLLSSSVNGGVYALEILEDKLVSAVNSLVRMSRIFTDPNNGHLSIKHHCGFRSPTIAISLSGYKNYLLVGDLMKSVTLLKINKSDSSSKSEEYIFEEVSRHFEPMWMTDIEIIDESTSIGAEAEGNIVVFHNTAVEDNDGQERETSHSFLSHEYDQSLLEIVSSMKVGEVVNKIRRVKHSANMSFSSQTVTPQAYFATRDGGIYLYGKIRQEFVDTLINLQSNMSKVLNSAGNMSLLEHRAFSNVRRRLYEPLRFVDGDFIEQFLELSVEERQLIVEGNNGGINLGFGVDQITEVIEDLKRLH
ncbi:CPSF A subunit region-domain-containing protein [Dipodascopsis uninucleata]